MSSSYLNASAHDNLDALIHLAIDSQQSVLDRFADLDLRFRALFNEEVRLARAVAAVEARTLHGPMPPQYFVSAYGKTHRPLDPFYTELPPHSWKARCGWTFGLSNFDRVRQRPPGLICADCFRLEVDIEPAEGDDS